MRDEGAGEGESCWMKTNNKKQNQHILDIEKSKKRKEQKKILRNHPNISGGNHGTKQRGHINDFLQLCMYLIYWKKSF